MSTEANKPPDPPKPPLNTNQILLNILDTDQKILKESEDQSKRQIAQLAESVKQGQTLAFTLAELIRQGNTLDKIAANQLVSISIDIDSKELLQQIVELLSPAPPPLHVYTIKVYPYHLGTKRPKEGSNMSVSPGVGAGFGAAMQDNGNPIPLPPNSSFAWTTDDETDLIMVSADSTVAIVTVSNPPATGRTSLTVSAGAVDPNGNMQSGSYTTDITAGVEHVFTVQVGPLPTRGSGGGGGFHPPTKPVPVPKPK